MSHVDTVLLIIGMAAGAIATVLAVAQLTCEHAESHWSLRATTVLLGILSAWSAIDCWEVWSGIDDTLDVEAVAFTVVLALSWGYRRAFGYRSERAPRG